jgi:predicted nucleotidyltransferase component of viral defense system
MIGQSFIEEWRERHPWTDGQVEQDLILSRAIVEIFSDDLLRNSLVFRGGTALHKLFVSPQARYSEDIDLIQINREPINPVLKRIREKLSFLGTKRTVKQHIHNNTMIYRFDTEIPPVVNMRLKIEINTREHLNVMGLQKIPFEVQNEWFAGNCNVTTYHPEEMLGSKLKALYGRKKGRDLFDLYWALTHLEIDKPKLLHCNRLYFENEALRQPTQKQFIRNMEEKLTDNEFTEDVFSVLRPEIEYNHLDAWELIKHELIEKLQTKFYK